MTPESVNTNEKKYLTSLKVLTVQRLRYLKTKKGMTLLLLDWSNSWGPPGFVHTLWSFCVKRQVYNKCTTKKVRSKYRSVMMCHCRARAMNTYNLMLN